MHEAESGLLRIKDLIKLFRVSRSTIYVWEKTLQGFPKSFTLGRRTKVWHAQDVYAYIAGLK
jgi:predicted DNA-binding transcriptional regulator AlpA